MEEDKELKWYQDKYNLAVTIIVLLAFGIAAVGFDVHMKLYETPYGKVLRNEYGIIFEWAIWLVSLTALIEAVLLTLDNYWKWISVTLIGITILEGIADTLSVFGDKSNLVRLVEGIWGWAFIGSPFILFTSVIIFGIKKLIISIKEQVR